MGLGKTNFKWTNRSADPKSRTCFSNSNSTSFKEYAQNIVKNVYKICTLERDYLQGHEVIGQGAMDSNWKRIGLN